MTSNQAPRATRTSKPQRIAALAQEGSKLLKDIVPAEGRLTELYRSFAVVVVNLRKEFKHKGKTDWRGQSQAYRDVVAKMYEEAGVPADSESNHQAAIRYHVSTVMREVLTPKQIAEAGLAAESQQQRKAAAASERRQSAGTEDPDEWRKDAIESLRSALPEDGHLIVLDLSAPEQDAVELIRSAHDALVKARGVGMDQAVPASVAHRLLTESVAEATAMLAELDARVQAEEKEAVDAA